MNRNFFLFIFFLIASAHFLPAQNNLISNPGFEDYLTTLPMNNFCDDKNMPSEFLPGWTHPSTGCPDYWNGDAIVGDEYNRFVAGAAHSGKGRVGLMLYTKMETNGHSIDDDDVDDYMDFMQTKLKEPMVAGEKYYLEFFLKVDVLSSFNAGSVGALFSSDAYAPMGTTDDRKPQIVMTTLSMLCDTNWNKISGYYIASGGEQYLTLGCFGCCQSCNAHHKLHSRSLSYYIKRNLSLELDFCSYYYMDDFLLTKDSAASHKIENVPADNVIMLVDVSRSMYEGKYMDELKTELKNYIAENGTNTKITLITFGSGIKVLLRSSYVNDTSLVGTLLSSFEEGGSTNIDKALSAGYALADSLHDPSVRTQIILFSDAEFQLKKTEQKLIRHESKTNHIEFAVYHYGKHENKELENALEKCDGYYAKAGEENISKTISRKEPWADSGCSCKDK
ncbi:MAG: VWA domain-containing protein [Bacteroidetes bacterium]|nr:VWA domain-containing protein [Bacteroidota bacterium]